MDEVRPGPGPGTVCHLLLRPLARPDALRTWFSLTLYAPDFLQADIGIKGHQIVGIGKGGNPDVMAGVTPGMVVGVNTEVIAGENQIVTAGALDAHGAFPGSG